MWTIKHIIKIHVNKTTVSFIIVSLWYWRTLFVELHKKIISHSECSVFFILCYLFPSCVAIWLSSLVLLNSFPGGPVVSEEGLTSRMSSAFTQYI